MTRPISVRPSLYRGANGFTVSGHDPLGRRVRIFATTLGAAQHIKQKVLAGERVELGDFQPREAIT